MVPTCVSALGNGWITWLSWLHFNYSHLGSLVTLRENPYYDAITHSDRRQTLRVLQAIVPKTSENFKVKFRPVHQNYYPMCTFPHLVMYFLILVYNGLFGDFVCSSFLLPFIYVFVIFTLIHFKYVLLFTDRFKPAF